MGVWFLANAGGYALAGTLGALLPPTGDKFKKAAELGIDLQGILDGRVQATAEQLATMGSNNLPSHADRLRAKGLLTNTEIAIKLGVHPSTIKSWTKAGILNSYKANDKNERLYEPPSDNDPRLTVRQGSPLRKRVLTQSTPEGAL